MRSSARPVGNAKKRRTLSSEQETQSALVGEATSVTLSLPIDILVLIFGYVSDLQRLDATSLACKRWRIAALHSFTSLTLTYRSIPHPGPFISQALPLFPALTDLTLCLRGAEDAQVYSIRLPTSLHRLTIKPAVEPAIVPPSYFTRYGINFSAPFPALTHLSVGVWPNPDVGQQLLTASVESVTSLHLGLPLTISPTLATLLAELHLPKLTDFSFRLLDKANSGTAIQTHLSCFTARHSAQLTSLSLWWTSRESLSILQQETAYPLLQHLRLHGFEDVGPASFVAFLARCPQLLSIHTDASFLPDVTADCYPAFTARTCVTALDCEEATPFAVLDRTYLPALQSLKGLLFADGSPRPRDIEFLHAIPDSGHVSRVLKLRLFPYGAETFVPLLLRVASTLPYLTSLALLAVDDDLMCALATESSVSLPHLTTLRLTDIDLESPKRFVKCVARLATYCPRLAMLDLVFEFGYISVRLIDELGKVLLQCQSLERVRIFARESAEYAPEVLQRTRLLPKSSVRFMLWYTCRHVIKNEEN